jgi:hypothetical protein
MKTQPITSSALRGFISGKLATVLAVIISGVCVLAYEWEHAHPGKSHHGFSVLHHHK